MGTRLFVGNLSYETTEETLRAHLGKVGPVKNVSIMRDRETGQSRGFAFAEMETDEAAQEAIQKFNNGDFEGRQITIKEARPREERAPRAAGGRPPYERPSGGGGGSFERRPPSSSAPSHRPAPRPERGPSSGMSDFGGGRPLDDRGPMVTGPEADIQVRKPKRREHPKGGHLGSSGGGSGSDWDRPRRGRAKTDTPPPTKNRMRAWDLDDENDEDLDDVDPWAGFDALQEDEESEQE